MNTVSVTQSGSSVRVADRAQVAGTWWHRLRGLLGRPALGAGEGMLLLECDSVHTVGMGYPIDVAFLDREGRVVRTVAGLQPWRVGLGGRAAAHALELPAGRLAETGIHAGTHLDWS